MRIGLTGTQSVGKSYLVKELIKLPQFKEYKEFTERSKYLRDLGIKLNTDSTLPGQFIFAAERFSELMNEKFITDRKLYDVSAFTLSSSTIDWYNKRSFVELLMFQKDNYDVVIYVSPKGVNIEDNGVRETNSDYRDKIDFIIKEMLIEYPPKKLIKVEGTTEERIQTILKELSF